MLDTPNTAFVEGISGTLVAPAHSPYDRQILREYLERRVGRDATATLGVRGTRWMITRRGAGRSHCTACTQLLGLLSCDRGDGASATCIDCAMRPEKIKSQRENASE